jgi:hypothetical protein
MGEIIRFRPREGARIAPASLEGGSSRVGEAEILLFLGVRYERHEEVGAGRAKTPTKRGRPRKRA